MAFLKVKLIVQDKTFSVAIDENANPKALVQGFVDALDLPGDNEYELHLVGAFRIHEGATLRLVEVRPESLFRILK